MEVLLCFGINYRPGADRFQMYLDKVTYLDTLFMNVSRYVLQLHFLCGVCCNWVYIFVYKKRQD